MPENIENKSVFSLFEVTRSIQKTITERYKSTFWVKAEMHKLNLYTHSGHCYPELVEKNNGKTVAEMRAIIWRDDFLRVNNLFKKVLKGPLKDGITVLFCAKISYDPKYGLTLIISDIDPSYSLGELEREKQQTIDKLKQQGIYDQNKNLPLALLPKRLAIISVATSKGYSDFIKIINGNPWGYSFFQVLFPALLQGEKAIASITDQLKRIAAVRHHFDAVAIIRGGGGDVGLSCYNDYKLAEAIALFPLPVFTGIGHSTNETVSEMVAFQNAITPSELADMLMQKFHNFSVPVQRARDIITDKVKRRLTEKNLLLLNTVKYFRSVSRSMIVDHKNFVQNTNLILERTTYQMIRSSREGQHQLITRCINLSRQSFQDSNYQLQQAVSHLNKDVISKLVLGGINIMQSYERLSRSTPLLLRNAAKEISNLEKSCNNMDPVNVLKRGYSITFLDGKVITSKDQLRKGDVITSRLADGDVSSVINE